MNPGLRWILIVIGLLAGNVIAVVTLIVVAGPADADRVLPAYYDRAARFGDTMTEESTSAQLGWDVTAALAEGVAEVRLRDAASDPIRGANIEVTGYHRAHAGSPVALVLREDAPGTYRAPLATLPGWWDLTVRSTRGTAHHMRRLAVEAH